MRDPRNYFINPFDNPRISFDEMAALTTDHLGKLGNQNAGGTWTTRLVATTTAFAAFDDTIADNITQQNARAARKQVKNQFRETLPLAVRNIVKWVEAAFGEGSGEVRAVIGDGTTALSNAADDKVEDYLESVIDALTPLIGNGVDAQRLTDANALLAQWNAIYAASEQSTADKRLSEEERRATKAELAAVLFRTLQEVAMMYPGNPDVLGNFFTPSLAGGPPISGGSSGGGGDDESSSSFPSSSFPSSSFPSSSYPSSSYPSSSYPSSSYPSSSYPSSSYPSSSYPSSSYPSSSSSFPSSSSSSSGV